jgi:AcrR family transcriptional regulator
MPIREGSDPLSPRLNGRDGARERILETAYTLFSHEGIGAVGIDKIVAGSSVAKMTLYRHFASKQGLVIAFLDLRHERWTCDWMKAEVERRALAWPDRALALFEILDEWFHSERFEGCSFTNTLLETRDPASPVRVEAVRQLELIREIIEGWAEQGGVSSPTEVAFQLQVLMLGAILSATRGDLHACRRVRPIVESLVLL